jgi:hypothetical protein
MCHERQSSTVYLPCEIEFWPQNNSMINIDIEWYRTRQEPEPGGNERGTMIDEYTLFGGSIRQYRHFLVISNFNSSSKGYYWCQIVVNNVSLSPSPYGYISTPCALQDVMCEIDPPLCAHNMSAQYHSMAYANTSGCSLEDSSTILPTVITTTSQTDHDTESSIPIAEIVSSIAVLIILFLLTIILILSIVYIKKYKSQSKPINRLGKYHNNYGKFY